MATGMGQWVNERRRSQERKQWDNKTTKLTDVCNNLEIKDGLLEGVRHVLMATTMTTEPKATRRDEGNKETKEEGSDRRVDKKKGTKNSRRADGKMGTKINRRVEDTMELKNGWRAEGKMGTKIDRRVETKNGRRADNTEIKINRRVDSKMGATRIIRRVDENGNMIGMASNLATGMACILAVSWPY